MSAKAGEEIQGMARSYFADDEVVARYMRTEKLTGLFAQTLIDKSGIAAAKDGLKVLDLATGTGVVVAKLYDALPKEQQEKAKVVAGDNSDAMLGVLRKRAEAEKWPGLEVKNIDGNNLQLPQDDFTHIFVSFGIFVMKLDTTSVLHSLLKSGGFLGFTTWQKLAWYTTLEKAIKRAPSKPYCATEREVEDALYSGHEWQKPAYVESLLRDTGFEKVETKVQSEVLEMGTPKENTQIMELPLKMLSAFWEESKRSETVKEVLVAFEETLTEEFGVDGKVRWTWNAVIATGWKP